MLKGRIFVIVCFVLTGSDYWFDNGFRERNLEDPDTNMRLAKEDDDVWHSGSPRKKRWLFFGCLLKNAEIVAF
jgi:hypothetical protein